MQKLSILITGASSGIGRSVALKLSQLNYQVFATVRNQTDAEVLKKSSDNKIIILQMDVTDAVQIKDAFTTITEMTKSQGLYALINNAGIVIAAPVEYVPINELKLQMEINVIGAIRVIQAALPLLRVAQGKILNIGSPSAKTAYPVLGPYGASKAALALLTQTLRLELYPWKVQTTLIEPGMIATPIWEKSTQDAITRKNSVSPELQKYYDPYLEHAKKIYNDAIKGAVNVNIVADKIAKILALKKLKHTYAINHSIPLMHMLIRTLPRSFLEKILLRVFGLTMPSKSLTSQIE